jgi:hypothetical protein
MARLRHALIAGLAALALVPGAVHGQAKKPAAAPKPPSQAQLQQAANNFSVLMGALNSDKIPQPVKNVLFVCIYSNPFSKINEGTEKVMAQRKVARSPDNIAGAMAAVCGLKPEMLNRAPAKK